MDPYLVLGINYNATQEEIKLAYRRVAMKWHPDRNQNSSESRERFHQAAAAYKLLFERASREKPGESGTGASSEPNDAYTDSSERPSTGGNGEAGDDSADSVFWNVMLDYAIKLAQNGMSENEITLGLCRNGCPERLAQTIAEKAFNINAHYATGAGTGGKRRTATGQTSFKQERQDAELWRAFIGQRSFVLSARDAVESYLVVFRQFSQASGRNPLDWVSVNKRLLQILNFAVVLFATMLTAVHFFPGPAPYKLLADHDLLQVPFLLLPLMLAWMLYRKLWLAALAFSLCFLGSVAYYDQTMPRALDTDLYAVAGVAAVCFAPFVVAVLFANFLYYLKAQRLLRRARKLFIDHLDQMVWIKNRAGTSASAAFLFVLVFIVALVKLLPGHWQAAGPAMSPRAVAQAENDAARMDKINRHVSDALQFFNIAEKHFNDSPPDYVKAEMAYDTAANNGSLLAAYKLGYMYYYGEGATQNDSLAFEYFQRATQAPLAFQPHGLDITTRFLAEAYNNLGIMYQGGLGTRKDLAQANRMYRRAEEFGSTSAAGNRKTLYQENGQGGRKSLVYPDYQ